MRPRVRTAKIIELSVGGSLARLAVTIGGMADSKPVYTLELFELDQEFEPGVIVRGQQLLIGHQEVINLHQLLQEAIK